MKKLSFFIVIIICAFACQNEESPQAMISFDLSNTGPDKIIVRQIVNGMLDTIKISDNKGVANLNITKAEMINFSYGRSSYHVFAKPGDQLSVRPMTEDSTKLEVVAKANSENDFLNRFMALKNESNSAYSMMDISKAEPNVFLDSLILKYDAIAKLVAECEGVSTINQGFKEKMQHRLYMTKGIDLMNYPSIYEYHFEKKAELPENFFAEVNDLDINDPVLLEFEEGRSYGQSFVGKGINFMDFKNTSDYFDAILSRVDVIFDKNINRDFFKYSQLSDKINFGGGVDGMDEILKNFKEGLTNDYVIKSLAAVVNPWQVLKRGNKAPDFSGQTREGKQVNISEFKGKNVYIDVWATWCGPCIKEIPSLKKVEKEFHDKNIEFVSISIDEQKDAEKWKKFIEEKELGGEQIMASNAWKSEVVSEYNIKGIPRFILIDAEGNIVKADAPRPSDDAIKDLFVEIGI